MRLAMRIVAYERGDQLQIMNGTARLLFGYFLKVTLDKF